MTMSQAQYAETVSILLCGDDLTDDGYQPIEIDEQAPVVVLSVRRPIIRPMGSLVRPYKSMMRDYTAKALA